MSEYVKTETACKVACAICNEFAPPGTCAEECERIGRLKERAAATDAESVVRCKRCYYAERIDDILYCSFWRRNTEEDGYCHNGG